MRELKELQTFLKKQNKNPQNKNNTFEKVVYDVGIYIISTCNVE